MNSLQELLNYMDAPAALKIKAKSFENQTVEIYSVKIPVNYLGGKITMHVEFDEREIIQVTERDQLLKEIVDLADSYDPYEPDFRDVKKIKELGERAEKILRLK